MNDAIRLIEPEVDLLEQHRDELTAFCYRMVGSRFEAEDAVQETLLRAWRNFDTFEGRASLRSWLYRIATNVCIDILNGTQRRARPIGMGPAESDFALDKPVLEETPTDQIPYGSVVSTDGDPADAAELHETVRLAFIAALQYLPSRQRAVLILRDVLRWRAAEVAELLDTTVQSVNSVLQRARSTLREKDVTRAKPLDRMGGRQRELLVRYVDAFESYDMESITSLLHSGAHR